MKLIELYPQFIGILILAPLFNAQHCYKRCNCLKKRLEFQTCSPNITDINLYFNSKDITVYCTKMISNNARAIQTFDASYLKVIDDTSPLTLESMIRKCFKTKEKHIRYKVDLNKLNKISSSSIILENKDSIKYLKIEGSSDLSKEINISIVGPQFGANLETLVVNNITVSDLKNFFTNIPTIKTLDLESNGIDELPQKAFGNLKKLKILTLRNNKIRYMDRSMFDGSFDIISLDLSKNMIDDLERTTFMNLDYIRYLNLSKNNLKKLEPEIFMSMEKLEHLDLSENPSLVLPVNAFQGLSSLKTLNISKCNLKSIQEELLRACYSLQVLNLSWNNIKELKNDTFKNLTALTLLDLSHNNLTTLSTKVLQPLKKLQHIYLASNKLAIFSSEVFWSTVSLKTIDVSDNLISKFQSSLGRFTANKINLSKNKLKKSPSFLVYYVEALRSLNLSHNSIESVEVVKDLVPKNRNIEIDLSENNISIFNVTHLESIGSNWSITFNLVNNLLRCDCHIFKLEPVSAAKIFAMVKVTNLETYCLNQAKNRQCPIINIKNCPPKCLCYYRQMDQSIFVDCSYSNMTIYPQVSGLETIHYLHKHNQTVVMLKGNRLDQEEQRRLAFYDNVTKLDLSYNEIHEINWIPPKLLELNLEDNHLSTLSQKVVEELKHNEDFRKITLQDNPWVCDCTSTYLQMYLIEYNNFKVDPSSVYCKSSNESLLYAKICEISPSTLRVALPVGLTAILALISVLLALYFKYSMNIKIYLYSRNMCLWFVAEEEIDKEKTYDIFISYSHKDEDFVQKQLLPELESGEHPFKICIHYRDFLPGEFISKQIISSVMDSRRTLVVLSNNFMESVWGKMEFRLAHMQAINEGMARVIVIIYEDLNESILDDEMKAYLKTNTYVKWGDPWFWSKLRYALPHSKHRTKRLNTQSLESFHLK